MEYINNFTQYSSELTHYLPKIESQVFSPGNAIRIRELNIFRL